MTMENKLSLEGLIFQATKINVENNVLTITLNRPEKKNALNNVMMNEICYALSYAKQEREIRVFYTHFLCYFFSNFCTRVDYFRNFKSFRSSIFASTLDATCCRCILWMVFSKRVIKPYAKGWGINSFGGYLFSF